MIDWLYDLSQKEHHGGKNVKQRRAIHSIVNQNVGSLQQVTRMLET